MTCTGISATCKGAKPDWHFRHLQGREAWTTHGDFIERHRPVLGPGVAERFAWSRQVTDAQVARAHAFRQRFTQHLLSMLGDDGVLVMPTMPDTAPLRTDAESTLEDYRNRAIRLLCSAGLSGCPQLSVPGAWRGGAPLGLSLLAPPGKDRSLIALVEALDRAA
jgi:amidase